MRKINHFGVPTTTPQRIEVYAEGCGMADLAMEAPIR